MGCEVAHISIRDLRVRQPGGADAPISFVCAVLQATRYSAWPAAQHKQCFY
ncbi:hypothetical protein KDAU_14960 [Dictyobacter aurantiacus]|uniref:Uncharacterized protein n=1 Tax=Dictyobacter aurantiacus TaxID=1936993 RepID=A0A401ZBA4_9CHLR|nr:hypothetical protein KDAU_14960 [Dictyobacter aurantiacus]